MELFKEKSILKIQKINEENEKTLLNMTNQSKDIKLTYLLKEKKLNDKIESLNKTI